MARTKRSIARRFLQKFEADKDIYIQAAQQTEELIREILVGTPPLIHVIDARPKEPSSLWLKLCEKQYGQPSRQVSDLIAARVITYYKDGVPTVVKALTDALEIDIHRSIDKRAELETVKFGYASVHLIARTKGSWSTSPRYWALRDRWFEIQVRSILEHGWAEIEHEVVYKSGILYPPLIKRRFARIAGAIEMLEDEFVSLRDHNHQLIDAYKQRYSEGREEGTEIDSARLIALLEYERPASLGWREAFRKGQPFPAHTDDRCVKALKRTGIRTARALRASLSSKPLKAAEVLFAQEHRLSESLSHLNTARLAILLRSPTIFADFFPELMSDPGIRKVLLKRRARRPR